MVNLREKIIEEYPERLHDQLSVMLKPKIDEDIKADGWKLKIKQKNPMEEEADSINSEYDPRKTTTNGRDDWQQGKATLPCYYLMGTAGCC